MKKFLAVFDGFKMSKSTLDHAIHLAQSARAHLTGVFLDDVVYRSYDVVKVIKTFKNYDTRIKELDALDKKKRDKAELQFHNACSKAGIHFSVYREKGFALQDTKQQSMFADLMIINENETFTKYKQELPTRFMKDLLGDIQCPVLVVPDSFKPFEKIVLLYDGGPSSLHAIKMFSYLLGSSLDCPVEVLTVKDSSLPVAAVPDNKLMRDFIKRHFSKVTYTVLNGNAEAKIRAYLGKNNGSELLVLGAYRRSEVSRWFKPSMADMLMKELDNPLFIAHNK